MAHLRDLLGAQQERELLVSRASKGFTLVEVLTAIAVVALLSLVAVPNLLAWQSRASAQALSSRFADAVAWSRQTALSRAQPITLQIAGDCTWSTTVSGVIAASASLTSVQRSQTYGSASCSSQPATLTFSPSGMVSGSTTLVVSGYSYSVLASGTVLKTYLGG